MSKTVFLILTIMILTSGMLYPASSFSQQDKVNVLIGFNGNPDESVINENGGTVNANFFPFVNVLSVSIPESAISGISHNPNVSFVEQDLTATTLDAAEYANSWGVDRINADLVHPAQMGSGIPVAVIDTGIDYTHSDLNLNYAGGIDYVNSDSDPMDDQGHGTHVSGTLAAVANNGGVIGVAPQARLYGVKVLDSAGSGTYSNVIAGIKWASDNHMRIASLSLGGGASTALCDAVTAATNNGVLVIAAAGNSGNAAGSGDNVSYPAACADAVAVAATDQNNARATFSSTGSKVEISAPGVSINSSVPTGTCSLCSSTGYMSLSGTSMATPHVSGVAALVIASNTLLTNKDVVNILDSTAKDLGDVGRDSLYGYGLVSAPDAVAKVTGTMPNSAPSVVINSPANGAIFLQGDTISFLASATDVEDGNISANIQWTSSIDGVIGTGPQVSTNVLSLGTHSITATVTDRGGLSSSQSISITVNSKSQSTISVDKISYSTTGGKQKNLHLQISTHVTDGTNNISGATVSIQIYLNGAKYDSATSVTDSLGNASFTIKNAPSGVYSITIVGVTPGPWNGVSPANSYTK